MSKNIIVGKHGESIAAAHAETQGYVVVGENIRTPAGEIDLILTKDDVLVFAEVKTRTGHSFGFPESAVNPRKLQHMIDAASHYLADLDESPNWRLDVISIVLSSSKDEKPEIYWIENVSADR